MSAEAEIRAAIEQFIAAYNAGDLASLLACYSDDLIKTRQGAPPETKSETARRVTEVFRLYQTSVEVVNDELHVGGDTAFTRGSFRVSLTPKAGGETRHIDRRYLEIWRRVDGQWKVARTMDNEGALSSERRP